MMKNITVFFFIFLAFQGNAQKSIQKDKSEIFKIRKATNKAIRDYDIITETNHYIDDYVIVLGRGGSISGKQNYIERYKNDTVGYYVRKPLNVIVSSTDSLAIEKGKWIYFDKGIQQLGGDYTAHWRKILGAWKISGEVYVQLWVKKGN